VAKNEGTQWVPPKEERLSLLETAGPITKASAGRCPGGGMYDDDESKGNSFFHKMYCLPR
jgi:hypothetical protein